MTERVSDPNGVFSPMKQKKLDTKKREIEEARQRVQRESRDQKLMIAINKLKDTY